MQPIILTTLSGELGRPALDADLAAIGILARAGQLPLTAALDELAYPAVGRVRLGTLAARRALAKRALPDIPDYQRLPPEQAAADARHTARRLARGLPV